MQIKYLPTAILDTHDIGDHYRKVGGNKLAREIVQRIKKPVLDLKDNPHIAPPYELAPGIHRLVVAKGAFLVFYRVLAEVEVLHVRRAEREPVEAAFLEEIK